MTSSDVRWWRFLPYGVGSVLGQLQRASFRMHCPRVDGSPGEIREQFDQSYRKDDGSRVVVNAFGPQLLVAVAW